ncbi:MAG: SDR family oxidoreductase [Acidiferrobacterales bacterium]|nr:SDR family oxidoreductase [Acidiferrobacterales bacterium]
MSKFKHSTAVITGAGSGIGRQLALALAQHGANIAISDVDDDSLSETESLIDNPQIQIHTQHLDVANKTAVLDYAQAVQTEFGEVNLVINNAGVALNTGTFEKTTIEEFEWLMSINFSGVLYGTKAFLPLLQQAKWGHIVNISSLFGLIGVPGQTAYNASKFAVRGLTEALRQELESSNSTVSCTSVHPGGVKTNIARNAQGGSEPLDKSDGVFLEDPEEFDQLARTTAESAARQILQAVEKNQRRLLIGTDAKLLDFVQRHAPNKYPRVLNWLASRIFK